MTKFDVYFMRHGKTYFNIFKRMQGWSDTPLAPEGIEVAEEAAETLKDEKFDWLFTSDTRRAQQTADIIIDKNKHHNKIDKTMPEFREEFYGYFEGNNSAETWEIAGGPHGYYTFQDIIRNEGMDTTKDWLKEADPYSYAENAQEYWERLDKGFDYLDSIAKDGDKILIISHGTTILSLADKYGDGSFEINEGPKNSSITHLVREDGKNTVTEYAKEIG